MKKKGLPQGFDFIGKEFPQFDRKKKTNKKTLYRYDASNPKRTNVLLFGDVFNKKVIYKYIDRRNFISYITGDGGFSICFQQPSNWTDKYEARFYKADYSKLFSTVDFVKNKQMSLYACCFASSMESEPSWKMYVNENNNDDRKVCVQIKINFKALLDYLNYYIVTELGGDYMLVVGRVDYMEKYSINKLHRPDEKGKLNSQFFKHFNFTKYLRLLLIKRMAFKYEDEIRMFLVPKKNVKIEDMKIIQIPMVECRDSNVPVSKKWGRVVDTIFLDPKAKPEEVKEYFNKLKSAKLKIEKDQIEVSNLYDSYSHIIIGEDKDSELARKEAEVEEEVKKIMEEQKKKLRKRIKASI